MDSSFARSSSSLGRKKEKTTICFIDTFPLSYSGFFVFLSLSLWLDVFKHRGIWISSLFYSVSDLKQGLEAEGGVFLSLSRVVCCLLHFHHL